MRRRCSCRRGPAELGCGAVQFNAVLSPIGLKTPRWAIEPYTFCRIHESEAVLEKSHVVQNPLLSVRHDPGTAGSRKILYPMLELRYGDSDCTASGSAKGAGAIDESREGRRLEEVERAKAKLEAGEANAAPFLVAGLRGESDQARKHCLELLKKPGSDAKAHLGELRNGLKDGSEAVQIACATAIGYLGEDGHDAEDDLMTLVNSKNAALGGAASQSPIAVGHPEKSATSAAWRGSGVGRGRQARRPGPSGGLWSQGQSDRRRSGPADRRQATANSTQDVYRGGENRRTQPRTAPQAGADSSGRSRSASGLGRADNGGDGCRRRQSAGSSTVDASAPDAIFQHFAEKRKFMDGLWGKKLSKKEMQQEMERRETQNPPPPPRFTNPTLIKTAATSLARIGPDAKAVLPVLKAALVFCRAKAATASAEGRTLTMSHGSRVVRPNGQVLQSKDFRTD